MRAKISGPYIKQIGQSYPSITDLYSLSYVLTSVKLFPSFWLIFDITHDLKLWIRHDTVEPRFGRVLN